MLVHGQPTRVAMSHGASWGFLLALVIAARGAPSWTVPPGQSLPDEHIDRKARVIYDSDDRVDEADTTDAWRAVGRATVI
jgi:hypothetical protein